MVDAIDPVLDLEYNASVLGDGPGEVLLVAKDSLGALQRERTVLAVARVQLDGVLVRVDVEPNAGPGGVDVEDSLVGVVPVALVGGVAVYEPAVVWLKEGLELDGTFGLSKVCGVKKKVKGVSSETRRMRNHPP